MRSALAVGLGATGVAVARHLSAEGWHVTVVEDRASDAVAERAAQLPTAVELAVAPPDLSALVAGVELVVPSPGVPPSHPVFALAAAEGVTVWSEIELAFRATDVPVLAITGTNGKTTVTTLVTRMLEADGRRSVAAGNIGLPFIEAVAQPADVFVLEVSSFQLELTDAFRPIVATWLNLAPDHLDWHPSLDAYAAAKARIWANQSGGDVAIVNAEDPVVMAHAARAPAGVVTFGLAAGDVRLERGVLLAATGEEIVSVDALPRQLPHDLANALAASATAMAAGATVTECRDVLTSFEGLPHRVELVGDAYGVRYYDDSKATTPASVRAALAGFESVVLIAGGRNKGLDLSTLVEDATHVRAVVAIGEAAHEVEAAFGGVRPVTTAGSMDDAVAAARRLAQPGDVVLLSPGCASYDWYRNYNERGDDFARAVRHELLEAAT